MHFTGMLNPSRDPRPSPSTETSTKVIVGGQITNPFWSESWNVNLPGGDCVLVLEPYTTHPEWAPYSP